MQIHIYNPEHDTCLARNVAHFVIPRTALAMRSRFDHVPAYWAADGDWVVVSDVASAQARLESENRQHAAVKFVTLEALSTLSVNDLPTALVPWGWDENIAQTFRRANPLFDRLIPTAAALADIRRMSSRVFIAQTFFPRVKGSNDDAFVGQMTVYEGLAEGLFMIVERSERLVLKAPWSNSGKGVRFVGGALTANDKGWVRNVLSEQGAIVVEPRYEKLLDCAMEFYIDAKGSVIYCGLSLFTTKGGTYQGNVIASERHKRQVIEQYIPADWIDIARERLAHAAADVFAGTDENRYHGPFGVDMMVVRTAHGTALHPCVELNLRYTMGHATLLK